MRGRAGGRENNKNSDIWNTSDDALVEENEYLNFTEMLFYQLRIHLPRTVSWRLGSRCGHSSLISPRAHFILSSLCSLNFLFPYIGKALHFHPIESTSRTSSSCVAVSSKGMVSKSFVYIYTYIYSGDSGLILESAEVILQGGHVKSDFFLIFVSTHRRTAQGQSLSSSIPMSTVPNGKFACEKERLLWSYMNHSEGHCPT